MDRALRIQWIVDGVQGSDAMGYTSSLASNRYRVLAPYHALREQRMSIELLSAAKWDAEKQTIGRADVVAIGKLPPGGDQARVAEVGERVLQQIRRVQASNVKVVADFNDDHFLRPSVGSYWQNLAAQVDLCVAGSPAMDVLLRQYTRQAVHVIGDPVLATRLEPRIFRRQSALLRGLGRTLKLPQGSSRLQFLWFGNLNNWAPMEAWLEQLAPLAEEQPWLLRVVTNPHPSIQGFAERFNAQYGPRAFLEFVEWDTAVQADMLAQSHIVLLPSDAADRAKNVKTANRLTDALQAGNHVIATPLPSYQTYAAGAVLTEAPLDAVRAYLAAPDEALARIRVGQELVSKTASSAAIAERWNAAFASARASVKETVVQDSARFAAAAPVRLNLGCGDKILPGYVNVDVVAARAGKAPDVMCDLRQLSPFVDDSVDEVMAVHVVEHFWRWEVEAVLREWLRVLKPGGRMVLECPNLQSACEAFLADPDGGAREDQAGQRTMWVFYGDPQWNDPLMVHRWGYTPQSLSALMSKIGLVDVRQEPAQYKLREPRDMRIVGFKRLQ